MGAEEVKADDRDAPNRGMLMIGGRLRSCFEKDAAYVPINMNGTIPTTANDAAECQDRCAEEKGCAFFSFDHVSMNCHLQDSHAKRKGKELTFIAGPRACTKTTPALRSNRSSTSLTTAPPAQSTKQLGPLYVSLYCFLVLMPTGYEPDLVRSQVQHSAGVFACDEHEALSVAAMDLGSGIHTLTIKGIQSTKGAWGSWLNTRNFLQAWDALIAKGRFLKHDWTVKVDPDCVFFPDRLKLHLQKLLPMGTDEDLYIKNCPKDFGMMGSMEVFSRGAVETYGKRKAPCFTKLNPDKSGEDGFMQACMEMLHVGNRQDFGLLIDSYCGFGNCASSDWTVAFHPYKDTTRWFQCWGQAKAAR